MCMFNSTLFIFNVLVFYKFTVCIGSRITVFSYLLNVYLVHTVHVRALLVLYGGHSIPLHVALT